MKKLLLVGLLAASAQADSPLTEVVFWGAYRDIPQVVLANDIRRLNTGLGDFLLSAAPLDQKAAVINALSWSPHWQENALLFQDRLREKYATPKFEASPCPRFAWTMLVRKHQFGRSQARSTKQTFWTRLSATDSFCLGYLEALDHYKKPAQALPKLNRARRALPKSYTVLLVESLVVAQLGGKSPQVVWQRFQPLFEDRLLTPDLRPLARQAAYRALVIYRDFCPPSQTGTQGVDQFSCTSFGFAIDSFV